MKYKMREYRPGHWQVYFQDHGKQVFLQKLENGMPLDSVAMARVLILHLKRDGYDPRRFNKDKEFHFDVAVRTWVDLSDCCAEWRTERKRIAEKFLIPHFKTMDFREIKTVHVRGFEKAMQDKGIHSAYLRNIRDELRSFLRFNKDSIPKLPDFRKLKVQTPMVKWLTPEEQDLVLSKISKRHIPIFTFLRTYPVRPNEACGLRWDGVFEDAEIPYFLVKDVVSRTGIFKPYTKTKKIRPYPILEETAWIFERNGSEFVFNRDGKPYTPMVLYDIWRKANLKTDVQRISLYMAFKHSFGWRKIDEGYSLEDVSLLMGHSSTAMTRRYAGQTLKRMAEILRGRVHKPLLVVQDPKLLELKGNLENQPLHVHGRPTVSRP